MLTGISTVSTMIISNDIHRVYTGPVLRDGDQTPTFSQPNLGSYLTVIAHPAIRGIHCSDAISMTCVCARIASAWRQAPLVSDPVYLIVFTMRKPQGAAHVKTTIPSRNSASFSQTLG